MKRLIIREGGRIIRHELGDTAVTLGRDPACDLFFSDQRLSRKHCRIVATPDGVRFEDLASRNGSYVDSKRIDVLDLTREQSVRLGGLILSYEDDTPEQVDDETVMLSTQTPDEDETVVLSSPPSEPTPRLLTKQPPAASKPTAPKPTAPKPTAPKPAAPKKVAAPLPRPPSPPPDEDKTVILPSKPVAPAKPVETAKPGLPKTRVLDANALAGAAETVGSDTLLLGRDVEPPRPTPSLGTPPPHGGARPSPPSPMPEDNAGAATQGHGWWSTLSWSAKFLCVVASVAFVVYFILAFPLVRTLGSALREESLRRGRALLSLAAASNGTAVGEGRVRDASVDNVLREERVKEALLLDLDGNVLAPSSRADEVLTTIDGISAELGDIRTFYLGRRGADYVMVQPLLHRSRRVGFAVLVYEAASASGSWATAVLFLGFLVLLLGVACALVFGKRMTLEPLSSFGDDIEAVVKGDADYVPPQQGFAELSELAKSVNRLIARSFIVSVAPPASSPPGPPSPDAAAVPAPPPLAAPAARLPSKQTGERVQSGTPVVPKRPIAAAVQSSSDPDAAKFWVDENFIVVRADDGVASLVGGSATDIVGKHIIEAVADQKLLEVILDTVNALEELPAAETTAELPGGTKLHVSATKERGSTVVGLRQL